MQLILIADDLASVLNESGQTDTILLDFSTAFNNVPPQHLLLKFYYYGLHGQTLHWIKSFLADRTQQVAVQEQ